eukprot:1852854-Prymnesium_polylepis.1
MASRWLETGRPARREIWARDTHTAGSQPTRDRRASGSAFSQSPNRKLKPGWRMHAINAGG